MSNQNSLIKTWENEISRCQKKIITIKSKALKDIADQEKKILDLKNKIKNKK